MTPPPTLTGSQIDTYESRGFSVQLVWRFLQRYELKTGGRVRYRQGSRASVAESWRRPEPVGRATWAPKYRFKVLHGEVRLRVREIIKQVCAEMGVTIISGVLSRDHVHMFVEIPPHISVSDLVRRAKGRSSRKIQQEFEHIRKRYWGQRFWQRGYFSTTSGNITNDIIMNYLDKHIKPNEKGFSQSK